MSLIKILLIVQQCVCVLRIVGSDDASGPDFEPDLSLGLESGFQDYSFSYDELPYLTTTAPITEEPYVSNPNTTDITEIKDGAVAMTERPVRIESVDNFVKFYSQTVLPNVRQISENPEIENAIASAIAERLKQLSTESENIVTPDVSVILKSEKEDYFGKKTELFVGNEVIYFNNFHIRQECMTSDKLKTAYVVYKENTSPLKPLPFVANMVRHQVMDVFRFPDSYPLQPVCPIVEGFEMVVMQFRPPSSVKYNVKRGCSVWNDNRGAWTSDDCFIFADSNKWATCRCAVQRAAADGAKKLHIIVYTYVEFTSEEVKYMDSIIQDIVYLDDGTRLNAFVRRIGELAEKAEQLASLESMLLNLNHIFYFGESIYMNMSHTELIHSIGTILEKSVPFQETGLIGRGSGVMSSFVVDLALVNGDPIIGYSFYADKEMWMEYQKSEDFDRNRLFGNNINYAFHFSPSVLSQISRYAFLLYPENTFFHPAPDFTGVREVMSFRVIDIVWSPKIMGDKKEELVYLYLQGSGMIYNAEIACAVWKDEISSWDEDVCKKSPSVQTNFCTCNLTLIHASRAQFIIYEFTSTEHQAVDLIDARFGDLEVTQYAMFFLDKILKSSPQNEATWKVAIEILSRVLFMNKSPTVTLDEPVLAELIANVRKAVTQCRPSNFSSVVEFTRGASAACFIYPSGNTTNKMQEVAFMNSKVDRAVTFVSTASELRNLPNKNTTLFVHVSDTVLANNYRFATIAYPVDSYPRALPKMPPGRSIVTYRVVEFILQPKSVGKQDQEQFVAVYVDMTVYGASAGCAFRLKEYDVWMEVNSSVWKLTGFGMCNFSLPVNFELSSYGGQYLVYGYVDAEFNLSAYKDIGRQKDTQLVLSEAYQLLESSSHLVQDMDTIVKNLRVLDAVLSIYQEIIAKDFTEVCAIIYNFKIIFQNYLSDKNIQLTRSYSIETNSSSIKAQVLMDLYSNTFDNSEEGIISSMYLVALGNYNSKKTGMNGFFFARDPKEEITFTDRNLGKEIENSHPTLGVFFREYTPLETSRFIFIVYPLNKIIYPSNMRESAIFNVRQIDVFSTKQDRTNRDEYILFHFQPTRISEMYIRFDCAIWDKNASDWDRDYKLCYMIELDDQPLCQCNIKQLEIMRLVVYEFADIENFVSKHDYDNNTYVFLICAFFSFMGLALIFVTAIFYPEWRQSFGNKIFINLTTSTLFYLILVMTRETHNIYAIPQYNNKHLIAYNFVVHYTRLAHYNWMFVVSILQWKGESWTGLPKPESTYLLLKLMALAWSLPLIPLVALLTWNVKVHFLAPHRLTHYLLFIAPGGLIGIVNLSMLVAISIRMWRYWYAERKNYPQSAISNRKMMVVQVKSISKMFFLFGIPTVFEVFNDIGTGSKVVECLFKLTDPLQGFMLFVFFICGDRGTRNMWTTSKKDKDEDNEVSQTDYVSYAVGNEEVRFETALIDSDSS